jgi:hypothetical protein
MAILQRERWRLESVVKAAQARLGQIKFQLSGGTGVGVPLESLLEDIREAGKREALETFESACAHLSATGKEIESLQRAMDLTRTLLRLNR